MSEMDRVNKVLNKLGAEFGVNIHTNSEESVQSGEVAVCAYASGGFIKPNWTGGGSSLLLGFFYPSHSDQTIERMVREKLLKRKS